MNIFLAMYFCQIHTNPAQTMRKLNPMNIPRIPPQSAKSEVKENASSSLRTWRVLLVYCVINCVLFGAGFTRGSSANYGKENKLIDESVVGFLNFDINPVLNTNSTNTHNILRGDT